MTNKTSQHDKLFKTTMSQPTVVKEYLKKTFSKKVTTLYDLETLKLRNSTFIDSQLKGRYVDILYSMQARKNNRCMYVLFEHLSNPDKNLPNRLMEYRIKIMENHKRSNPNPDLAPHVYTIVFYTGDKKYKYSLNYFDMFADEKRLGKKLFFNNYLFDINAIDENEFSADKYLHAMIKTYKSRLLDEATLIKTLVPVLKPIDKSGDLHYINSILQYVAITKNFQNPLEFFKNVAIHFSTKTGVKIMNMAERLRRDGWQEGMQRGMQRGLRAGCQKTTADLAKKLLVNVNEKISINKIINLTGLSKAEIEKLKDKQ